MEALLTNGLRSVCGEGAALVLKNRTPDHIAGARKFLGIKTPWEVLLPKVIARLATF
jgi:hypothetical protein